MKNLSSTALLLAGLALAIVASAIVFNVRVSVPHAFEMGVGIATCVGLFAMLVRDPAQDYRA
jgi:hypothetical protein